MKKASILIIDDDAALLSSLKCVLVDAGYQVTTADNGEKGLQALKEMVPDLIITDVKMPNMSGISLLRQISGADGKPHHPVLILTAHANMKGFFDNIDVDGFMLKPCSVEQLLAEVKRILEKRAPAAAPTLKPTNRRVLLAEDDCNLARDISQAFVRAGYKVTVADNGSDAIGQAISMNPDILVVKSVLAQVNGHAVVSTLRGIPKTQKLPVVLYDDSGFTAVPDGSGVSNHGFYWFEHGLYCFVPSAKPEELLIAASGLD